MYQTLLAKLAQALERVAGRPRDFEDIKGVLARSPQLDEKYLERWLEAFHRIVNRDLVSEYRSLKCT